MIQDDLPLFRLWQLETSFCHNPMPWKLVPSLVRNSLQFETASSSHVVIFVRVCGNGSRKYKCSISCSFPGWIYIYMIDHIYIYMIDHIYIYSYIYAWIYIDMLQTTRESSSPKGQHKLWPALSFPHKERVLKKTHQHPWTRHAMTTSLKRSDGVFPHPPQRPAPNGCVGGSRDCPGKGDFWISITGVFAAETRSWSKAIYFIKWFFQLDVNPNLC